MKHFFHDFETLGQNVVTCPVIDCACFVADTDKMISDDPYTTKDIINVKRFKLSVKDQINNYNKKIEADTVKFWENQTETVRKRISPLKNDLTYAEFYDNIIKYIASYDKIDYWWSRSNTFDPIILWGIFEKLDKIKVLNEYLPYWRVRDIRTFIDAKFNFDNKQNSFTPILDEEFWSKVFQQHNSSWDVLADVLRMQAILRAENEKEQINR
jgi:hypothetical protein